LSWRQHIIRIETLLRILERFPNRSIVLNPIGLRKRNRTRRQTRPTHIARPVVESAIHRDQRRYVGRCRRHARKLESEDQIFVRHTGKRPLDALPPPCRKARKSKGTVSADLTLLVNDGRFNHLDVRTSARPGGGFTFNIEGGAFYDAPNTPSEVQLLAGLRFTSRTARVMTYVEYYRPQNPCNVCTPLPHPWLYLCLPASRFVEYAARALATPAEVQVGVVEHE
jgi:hypothetical protein